MNRRGPAVDWYRGEQAHADHSSANWSGLPVPLAGNWSAMSETTRISAATLARRLGPDRQRSGAAHLPHARRPDPGGGAGRAARGRPPGCRANGTWRPGCRCRGRRSAPPTRCCGNRAGWIPVAGRAAGSGCRPPRPSPGPDAGVVRSGRDAVRPRRHLRLAGGRRLARRRHGRPTRARRRHRPDDGLPAGAGRTARRRGGRWPPTLCPDTWAATATCRSDCPCCARPSRPGMSPAGVPTTAGADPGDLGRPARLHPDPRRTVVGRRPGADRMPDLPGGPGRTARASPDPGAGRPRQNHPGCRLDLRAPGTSNFSAPPCARRHRASAISFRISRTRPGH